jgi:thymidine phosphorylase
LCPKTSSRAITSPAGTADTMEVLAQVELPFDRLAGAPQILGAGVDLLRKVGDPVQAGQPMYRLHAQYPTDLEFARNLAARDSGYRLAPSSQAAEIQAMLARSDA